MKTSTLLLALLFINLTAFNQKVHIFEDFDTGMLPAAWTNSTVSGTTPWLFGLNGATAHPGNTNLNGTAMAYFDDDNLGSSSTNNTVRLVTDTFDNSNDIITTLEFDYNYRQLNGITDSFNVDVFDGSSWIRVFSLNNISDCGNYTSASCSNNFPHAVVNISAYANTNCQVRFTYHDGDDWGWYVGIDNVIISSPFNNDIQVSEVITPNSDCGLTSTEPITVKIKNTGTQPASNFDVVFDMDNGAQMFTETVTGTIAPGDSLNYTFIATANLSAIQTYSVNTYTNLAGDGNTSNDTTINTIESQPSYTPTFIDDFEGNNLWKIQGTNPSWQLGTPIGTTINSASSGTMAYVTNLNGNYNNNETSYLVSPCFDFSGISVAPIMSFDLNYRTEMGFDTLTLESSIDNGLTWQRVVNNFNASNFFNGIWQGNSNGWINVENRLNSFLGISQVLFRFKFQSDGSGSFEGIGIDNFTIRNPFPIDLEISQLIHPSSSGSSICGFSSNENIVVEIENKGANTIDTTILFYQVNSGTIFFDTLISAIPAGRFQNFTFSNSFDFSSPINYSIDIWINTNGDGFRKNDSLLNQQIINTNTSPGDTLPFFEDFETSNPNLPLPSGWVRTATTGFHWSLTSGSTNSLGTGPDDDHTPAPGTFYIYTEASGTNTGSSAILETPCIDLGSSRGAILEFWSHRFGTDMPDLFIDVFDGTNWVNADVITTSPQTASSTPYTLNKVNLGTYIGRTVKLRFRTGTWIGFLADMAIDDVRIYEPIPQDVQVNQLISPVSGCDPDSTVTVELENFGSTDITSSFPITLQINNGTVITESVNLPILVGEKKNFTFSIKPNFSTKGNTYTIEINTSLSGDSNITNNRLIRQITNYTQSSIYTETFQGFVDGECPPQFGNPSNQMDTLLSGWQTTTNGGSEWQMHDVGTCGIGTANTGATGPVVDNSASGLGKFIYVESSGGNGTAQLITPCIDFSTDSIASMGFWYHAFGNQIGTLTVDVLANGTWNPLPGFSIVGQQQINQNDPWILVTDTFNQFAGQHLTFRFNYAYTGGFGGRGDFAIDDIFFLAPLTTGSNELNTQNTFGLYPNPNNGIFTLKVEQEMIGKVYQVMDLKGSTIKTSTISSAASTIDLNTIEKGIYFLKIETIPDAKKVVVY